MPYRSIEARREYQRNLYRSRRDAWLRSKGGRCVNCGCTEGLQVDHRDPARKITHRVFLLGAERRKKELAKCQPLCATCHRFKTGAQRSVLHPDNYQYWYDRRAAK